MNDKPFVSIFQFTKTFKHHVLTIRLALIDIYSSKSIWIISILYLVSGLFDSLSSIIESIRVLLILVGVAIQ